ncbi:MAG: glycosyltransferase [Pseudomonadota bacterium]
MSGLSIYFIAFYFPPVDRGSGVFRIICNAREFVRIGWQVSVLTVREAALPDWRKDYYSAIPAGVEVQRAFGFDARRHLSIAGRYPDILATPDRWATWIPFAIPRAIWHVWRHQPSFVVTTSPIASAHVIGAFVSKVTKARWVAELRDPLLLESHPSEPLARRVVKWLEGVVVRRAEQLIFTTDDTLLDYEQRYGAVIRAKSVVIENGYDEQTFSQAERRGQAISKSQRFTFLHSGVLYPDGRDAAPLLEAVARLKSEGLFTRDKALLKLRASGTEAHYAAIVAKLGVEDVVEISPGVGLLEALSEMLSADALVLIQGSRFNRQVPAKLYDYARAGRPLLCLVDSQGATAKALGKLGLKDMMSPDDVGGIRDRLEMMIKDGNTRQRLTVAPSLVAAHSREARARRFAELLAAKS